MKDRVIYAYIKGSRYKTYSVYAEENEDFQEIKIQFESKEELLNWCINFSNYYSAPIQFYY